MHTGPFSRLQASDRVAVAMTCLWVLLAACDFRRAAPLDTPETADSALGPQWDCANRFWHKAVLFLSTETSIGQFCDTANAVDGDLTLHFGAKKDAIEMLDGISCLCEVTGDLELFYGEKTDDDTLPSPDAPSGPQFGVPIPHASADLELHALETIGGSFWTHDIPGLTDITGLHSLASVGGDIRLENLPTLNTVHFEALRSVGGAIQLLSVSDLEQVEFPLLTSAESFVIGGAQGEAWHTNLVTVEVPELVDVQGDFALGGAPHLQSLTATALETVGEAFHLDSTCAYTPSFPALREVGAFRFISHCGTEGFEGFSALGAVTGSFYETSITIAYNDAITDSVAGSFMADIETPADATVEYLSGSKTGCDSWFQSQYGQSQDEICK